MKKAIRGSILAAVLVFAGLATVGAQAATPQDPRAFITQLGNDAVDILAGPETIGEREAALQDLLQRAFDFDIISRLVLGRLWRQATPEQLTEYQTVFADFVVKTYSRRLADYKITGFSITGVREMGERDTLVETAIEQPDGPPLNFSWRVRDEGEALKLIDVVVDGVSMVISQRSEFASVVQNRGMDGLIEALRSKGNAGATPTSY